MKIINRYILSTYLKNFTSYLVVTTGLLFLNYMYQLVKTLILYRIEFLTIVKLILFILPAVISITLPVTTLISVLLTFSTLNETKELLVLYTMGINKNLFAKNFILLSILTCLGMTYFNTNLVPQSYKKFKQMMTSSIITHPILSFKNNVASIRNMKIVTKNVAKQKNNTLYLDKIFIYNPIEKYNVVQTIYAQHGFVSTDSEGNTIFNLYNGNIINLDKNNHSETVYIKFSTYKFVIGSSLVKKFISDNTTFREMTNSELIYYLKQTPDINTQRNMLTEFFTRYTLSVSIIVFTIMGIVIGTKIKSNAKPLSFLTTITVILFYYFFLTASVSIVEKLNIKLSFSIVGMIMQAPNIFMLVILTIVSAVLSKL